MSTGSKADFQKSVLLYQNAIEEEEEDKKALRSLSMVIRKLATGEDTIKILTQSIDYAKKAVGSDLSDSESWYILGNAHLAFFFKGTQQYEHLDFALKAYTQAEERQVYQNPDLYYNRATIYNYLEKYNAAIEDYEVAHAIDPNLGAKERGKAIEDFIVHVVSLIKKKGTVKNKILKGIVKTVPKAIGEIKFLKTKLQQDNHNEESKEEFKEQTFKYKVLTTDDCKNGENLGGVYVGKLICPLKKDQEVPICFLVVDSKFKF